MPGESPGSLPIRSTEWLDSGIVSHVIGSLVLRVRRKEIRAIGY